MPLGEGNRMSILIKGIQKPKCCGLCPCFHAEKTMYCQAVKADKNKKIVAPYGLGLPEWCPLVDIPKHGRLIDADKLKADNPRHMNADVPYVTEVTVEEIIDDAPTVIEAEE